MKKKSENVFVALTPDELKQLAMGTADCTAEGVQLQPKLFSAADLWHIQRSKKAVRSRRCLSLV